MKMRPLLFLLIVFVFLLGSCKKPGCIGNAGPVSSQQRPLQPFQRLILEDNIDLELIQADTTKIEIIAPENIIPNIQTIMEGDELTISNDTECRWLRNTSEKIKARLYFKSFEKFDYNGSGNVSNTDTIKLNALYIKSDKGAGTIELTLEAAYTWTELFIENANLILHGSSNGCYTFTNPRAQTDMSDFKVKDMDIIYSGLADTHIWVTDKLNATIRYKGNVYYKGDPVIAGTEFYSSGRLFKIP